MDDADTSGDIHGGHRGIRIRAVCLGGSKGVGIYGTILTVGSRTKVLQCCRTRVGVVAESILTISFGCAGLVSRTGKRLCEDIAGFQSYLNRTVYLRGLMDLMEVIG